MSENVNPMVAKLLADYAANKENPYGKRNNSSSNQDWKKRTFTTWIPETEESGEKVIRILPT